MPANITEDRVVAVLRKRRGEWMDVFEIAIALGYDGKIGDDVHAVIRHLVRAEERKPKPLAGKLERDEHSLPTKFRIAPQIELEPYQ